MKIDSALKEFTEKYNSEMIESIDDVSKNFGYNISGYKMPVVNINESVNNFKIFMEGYLDYEKKYVGNYPTPHERVVEQTNAFIESAELFKEEKIPYSEIPNYVKSYVEGIKTLSDMTDKVKEGLMECGTDIEYIGDVNSFVDKFTERMQESFYPVMDQILWASGYNARQRLSKAGTSTAATKNSTPVFI